MPVADRQLDEDTEERVTRGCHFISCDQSRMLDQNLVGENGRIGITFQPTVFLLVMDRDLSDK